MSNEKFEKWQTISLTQMGYAINLILTLTLATVGFCISKLGDEKFFLFGVNKLIFMLSMILLLISGALGIYCVINRLKDFRITTQIVRKKRDDTHNEEVECLRKLSKKLGGRTWIIFYSQILCFTFGVLFMVISILIVYWNNLF